MQFFLPDIRAVEDLPPQKSLEDKFGGLPWGVPAELWPKCADCGGSQSLLAQLTHDPRRLDLGRPGRVLLVFQCGHDPGMCSTWEGGAGANACFVVEPESLSGRPTVLPADAPPVGHEVRVVHWIEHDDGLAESLRAKFFDDEAHSALPDETLDAVSPQTHLGGPPFWIQSASEAPAGDWRFVGQLASSHVFITPPARDIEGPNFGDCGIGYIFIRPTGGLPEGYFFWQCG